MGEPHQTKKTSFENETKVWLFASFRDQILSQIGGAIQHHD
jgi:hypothetical protein